MGVNSGDRRRRFPTFKANSNRRSRSRRYATRLSRLELLERRELLHAEHLAPHSHPTAPDLFQDHTGSAAVIVQEATAAAITPQALLPDLAPWVSESRGFVYGWTIQGDELRLTTAMANIGTGRMELRGGAIIGNTQQVNQRIYEPNGSFTDVLAGTFTYHPQHGHIHFDGFAEYRLREVLPDGGVGAILSTGEKISFCLLDVERYDSTGPASPFYLTCGQVQGISSGWADVYDRGLDGQSINITNIANGNYWLEVVVDPDNHLIEANEENNVQRIQITLQRGGSVTVDAFEPNDSFAAASILAPPEDHTYDALSIHAAGNNDYYRVTASATGTLTVSLAFQHAQGDIDLEVFNASQTRLGISESVVNAEQLSVNAIAGQLFYIRAFGYNGAVNPNYTMTIDQPTSGGTQGDLFEDNDTFATARSLAATDQTYSSLSIEAPNDDDYFSLTPTASGTLIASLAFLNLQGDVNFQLFDAAQQLLASSATTADTELINIPVTGGQTYYLRVFGFSGAISPNYSMTIDFQETPPGDAFENNDTFATARLLPASNQTYGSLSIDAPNDDDYYSLTPTVSGTLTVSLAFLNSQGDIDLELLSATQTRLGLSESTGNAEQLSIPVISGQTYVIRAFGYNGAINPNYSMTTAIVEPPPGTDYYFSTATNGTLNSTNGLPSLSFADADILTLTVLASGQYGYQMHFDGSDVGLTTSNEDIDAFEFLSDGSIIVSTVGSFSVPAVSGPALTGSGEDLLRFVPTSLGATTAGQWSIYFDGSDVGLSGSAENIDAVQVLSDGRLLISTTGNVSVTGASGADEDLVAFVPNTLGATTAGAWSFYFDGSDVGLTNNNNEDISALYVRETTGSPTLFFTTFGNFSVSGVSGANEDIFAFNPTNLGSATAGTFGPGLTLDGSRYGLSSFAFDGIHLGALPTAGQAAALGSATLNSAKLRPVTVPISYRPRPSAHLDTSASKVSFQVELVSDALVAAVLKNATKKAPPLSDSSDCGCHSQAAASMAAPRFRPTTSGAFSMWDVLGDLPADSFTGQLV